MQQLSIIECLNSLETRLNESQSSLSSPPSVCAGELCLARSSLDSKLYRAMVVSIQGKEVSTSNSPSFRVAIFEGCMHSCCTLFFFFFNLKKNLSFFSFFFCIRSLAFVGNASYCHVVIM